MKSTKVAFTLLLVCNVVLSQSPTPVQIQKQIDSKTIVFIHGLFLNNNSWDGWKTYFERQGYTCYTPAHPKHAGDPTQLRVNPPAGLENVQLEDWIISLETLIDSLPEKPILIGHSLGGLTAQKLVESGRAAAAILISSAPPKGTVTFRPSFLRANAKVIGPLKGNSIFDPKEKRYKKWFHFAIANTFTRQASDSLFEQFVVPESRRTTRGSIKKIARIDTQKPHVPLLFVGGLEDVIVPHVLVRKTIRKYSDENSIVDYQFFEGKDHFICGAPGWEVIADYCLQWLLN